MPSRPPLQSEISPTTSGIIRDPHTGERVVAASKRPDGTLRKEIRIRPGYTPEEDVSKFRSARQQDSDRRALPKGSVVGLVRPEVALAQAGLRNMTATQRKNAKRKEKRKEVAEDDDIPVDWDADDDDTKAEGLRKDGNASGADAQDEAAIAAPSVSAAPSSVPAAPSSVPAAPSSVPAAPSSAGTGIHAKPSGGGAAMFKSALRSAVPTTPPAALPTSIAPISQQSTSASNLPSTAKPEVRQATSGRRAAGGGGSKLFGDAISGLGDARSTDELDPAKKARGLRKKLQQAEQLRDKQSQGASLLPEQEAKVASIAALELELASLNL